MEENIKIHFGIGIMISVIVRINEKNNSGLTPLMMIAALWMLRNS